MDAIELKSLAAHASPLLKTLEEEAEALQLLTASIRSQASSGSVKINSQGGVRVAYAKVAYYLRDTHQVGMGCRNLDGGQNDFVVTVYPIK